MLSIRTNKDCELCKEKFGEVYSFSGWEIESITGKDEITSHLECLFKFILGRIENLEGSNRSLRSLLSSRIEGDRLFDTIIKELEIKNSVNITKDITIYSTGKTIFLKITDYQKGYWAQVPLDKKELLAFIKFIQKVGEK